MAVWAEAEERIRLVHEESGWILRFQSGEEVVLDSELNYDLIRWQGEKNTGGEEILYRAK